jgi:hypothetical protein
MGEIVAELAASTGDAPDPSAELILLRVFVEAVLEVWGRKKGERCLRLMAEKLAAEECLSSVFHLRPPPSNTAWRTACRKAAVAFERCMPIWLARLPHE